MSKWIRQETISMLFIMVRDLLRRFGCNREGRLVLSVKSSSNTASIVFNYALDIHHAQFSSTHLLPAWVHLRSAQTIHRRKLQERRECEHMSRMNNESIAVEFKSDTSFSAQIRFFLPKQHEKLFLLVLLL